jgi:hypothetical protein
VIKILLIKTHVDKVTTEVENGQADL